MMKLFKNIVIGLLALIITLGVIAFILPSKVHIERSINIKAPKEVVFDQVNNLQNWEKWSPWQHIDTAMDLKYFGNEKGEGAGFEWKSDQSNVGCGSVTIFASKPYDSIYAEIDFLSKGKGNLYYLFKKSDSGTKVKWIFELNLGYNPITRYIGLFMNKRIGKNFENGLDSLKQVAENISTRHQLITKEIKVLAFTYIGIREKIKPVELGQKMGINFKELKMFIEKNKLKMTNVAFSIYYSFTKDEVEYEAGIPVEKCKTGNNKIKIGQMKACKAIVTDYYGPYSGLGKEYEVIEKWIVDNKKKISGLPFEMYITGPITEKDSTKWLTKIYYPVE